MMMKKTGLLAVLTAGVLLLAGCGGEAKTIDAQALAKSLATEIKYDDTLKELTADEISMLVDLPEDVDSVMYAGSGRCFYRKRFKSGKRNHGRCPEIS